MANPCFCCELKTATLVVAILDMILWAIFGVAAFIFLGFVVGWAVAYGPDEPLFGPPESDADRKLRKGAYGLQVGGATAGLTAFLLICAGSFYLGLILKRGVFFKDINRCKVWVITACIGLALSVGVFITAAALRGPGFMVITGIIIPLQALRIWVVAELIQEIKAENINKVRSSLMYNEMLMTGDTDTVPIQL